MNYYRTLNTTIKYNDIDQASCNNFLILDIIDIYRNRNLERPKIIYIESVKVDSCCMNQGYGSKSLTKFINNPSTIYCLSAGLLLEEVDQESIDDITKCYNKDLAKISYEYANNLVGFYEKIGFINVNSYMGQYESKVAMIFNNNAGRNFLNLLQNN